VCSKKTTGEKGRRREVVAQVDATLSVNVDGEVLLLLLLTVV
jgi:hypothetical protein